MNPATRRRIGLTMLAIVTAVIIVLAVAALVDHDRDDARPGPAAPTTGTTIPISASVAPSATGAAWDPSPPALPDGVQYAYARIDSTDGSLQLGGDVDRHPFDQLLVPGLAEDYLNVLAQRDEKRSPAAEEQIRAALAGNAAAIDWLAGQVGGAGKAFARIVDACQLDDARAEPFQAPPLGIARYGACLREGAITDADGAMWVLDQMRATRTGIGETRGDASLAQQNSTVLDGRQYRTGCLAIGPWWTAAVLVDYDSERGKTYGEAACGLIADALFPPDTQKVPERRTSPAPSVDAS
jgi:hypothetical protein